MEFTVSVFVLIQPTISVRDALGTWLLYFRVRWVAERGCDGWALDKAVGTFPNMESSSQNCLPVETDLLFIVIILYD